jgi:hypothetical protein
MTQERLTALEDVAALATVGATYPELMLYLQAEVAKCEQALAAQPAVQEPVACERCKQREEQVYDLLGRLQAANLSMAMLRQADQFKEKSNG